MYPFLNHLRLNATSNPHLHVVSLLLVFLILLGSVTMVNLIVAIIITDVAWLNKVSKDQVLLHQVTHQIWKVQGK